MLPSWPEQLGGRPPSRIRALGARLSQRRTMEKRDIQVLTLRYVLARRLLKAVQ